MGIVEQDLPADWGGGFALPLVLLIPLALVWAYYVMREPKDPRDHYGWFMPPTIITIAALILYAGASRLA